MTLNRNNYYYYLRLYQTPYKKGFHIELRNINVNKHIDYEP